MKRTINHLFNLLGYEIKKTSSANDVQLYYANYGKEAVDNKSFFNIGAGSKFYHPAWTNVDLISTAYNNKSNTHINYDLFSMKPLPIDDNVAEVVYISHVLEHIDNHAAINIFGEIYRILKKDGVFRMITPNIDNAYQALRRNDRSYFYWIDTYSIPSEINRIKLSKPMNKATTTQVFLHHFAAAASELHADSPCEKITDEEFEYIFSTRDYEEALDYCVSRCSIETQRKYPFNHINWWNKNKFLKLLKNAGFNDVHISGYGQSHSPVLRNLQLFDNTHPKMSLYIEAKK